MLSPWSAFLRDLVRNAFAVVSVATIFVVMAWTFGFTTDGLLYGRWDDGDYPTNWYDTALHP